MVKDKVLMEIPVLWEGWECDSKAWVMERTDGTRYLKMTNHGGAYEAKPEELHERIAEYENVLKQTREALALLPPNAQAQAPAVQPNASLSGGSRPSA